MNRISEEDLVPTTDPKIEHEESLVAERLGLGEMSDGTLNDFRFAMNRLHDPTNFDHTTLEDMLATYKYRNLEKSKIFRIAKKVFGDKMDSRFRTRTRTFDVSGLKSGTPVVGKTVLERPRGDDCSDEDEDLTDINDLRLRKSAHKGEKKSIKVDKLALTTENLADYDDWINKRRELRTGLNNLGLTESWLRNKPNKTDMEQILLEKMFNKNKDQFDDEDGFFDGDLKSNAEAADGLPRIRRTSPLAIKKLDHFLRTNKIRLLDIFRIIDKDKNWKVSRGEFMKAVDMYNMDISPALLEDLMATLDMGNDDELCYKDLAKGIELYRLERRDAKKKEVEGDDQIVADDEENVDDDVANEIAVGILSNASSRHPSGRRRKSSSRAKSAASTNTTLLSTPPPDTREGKLVLDSKERQVDIRKRDKDFLRLQKRSSPAQSDYNISRQASKVSSVLKTGYKPIDDHCLPSTMGGETAAMINEYRQRVLKEYHEVQSLCEEKGVILSSKLLDRVLLYPGDKNTRLIRRQGIRQPGTHLPLSRHFADPAKRPRTPIEMRNQGMMKRGKDGGLYIAYKHLFPSKLSTEPKVTKMQLPTGAALVSRRIDCWMTYEEYLATRPYYKERFQKMGGAVDMDKFWPGYMLDKIRQLETDSDTGRPSNALFRHTNRDPPRNHGFNNDLNNWEVSDSGYLLQGSLRHPKKEYSFGHLAPIKYNS